MRVEVLKPTGRTRVWAPAAVIGGTPYQRTLTNTVQPSALGYKSLGTASEKIATAQHCRAEVYVNGYGWAPADPADVRKVMLEEPPGHHPLDDEMVKSAVLGWRLRVH